MNLIGDRIDIAEFKVWTLTSEEMIFLKLFEFWNDFTMFTVKVCLKFSGLAKSTFR
jgi:hypothetical protein